jgi:hypothetical protein
MGSVAANMIQGDPVWLMFVGPPSCGKSELVNSLLSIPRMFELADISSEGAFLSGTTRKEKAADATGGLLQQVGLHGGAVLNDFTSVLSKPHEKCQMIMAVLRECFSGRWTRTIGGEGGRTISWKGRLALFGGVTNKIDQYATVSAEMGERWVYYRFDYRQTWAEATKKWDNDAITDWRIDLQMIVRRFFEDLDLGFGRLKEKRTHTTKEKVRLYRLAEFASRCRSGVARDPYHGEPTSTVETELPTRLAGVFSQLLVGLEAIGVHEAKRWAILRKVALDSMPRMRSQVLEYLYTSPDHTATVEELAAHIESSARAVKRCIEDLQIQRVVVRKSGQIRFTEKMEEEYTIIRQM